MLSSYCFCSDKFQSPRTEHLSSPPLPSSLPSESSCFLLCILFSLCFISLLLQISPPITEVESISCDPRLFSCVVPSQVSHWCVSHCCTVGDNPSIKVHVLISQSNVWCEFPTCRNLKSACHIWVLNFSRSNIILGWLAMSPSSDELKRSSSPGRGHFLCLPQESYLSYGCSLLIKSSISSRCSQSGCGISQLGYAMSIF